MADYKYIESDIGSVVERNTLEQKAACAFITFICLPITTGVVTLVVDMIFRRVLHEGGLIALPMFVK